MGYRYTGVQDLIGKTLSNINVNGDKDEIIFCCTDGSRYQMFHEQSCCESVSIEDICGDLNDLLATPIIQAEESTSGENPKSAYDDSFTWTFYKIATARGYVTIRWYGESNGYYSEKADFIELLDWEGYVW